MTPADHAALSAQLARALGWPDVTDFDEPLGVHVSDGTNNCGWFDYRDSSVALPVLEWLMREQSAWAFCPAGPLPMIYRLTMRHGIKSQGDTLHDAIARAAIAVADSKRQQVEQNEAREVLQP
jgi:hypothetical protein